MGGVGAFQSDIYHVGLTLYRAANGERLFQDQAPQGVSPDKRAAVIEEKTLSGNFPRRSLFLPHVPVRLRTVIRKALSVDPADRYQTAGEFSFALGSVDPTHNWKTIISPTGEYTWRADRRYHPSLIVCLSQNGSKWTVKMFTERNGKRRGRSTGDWADGLTLRKAFDYLKKLFESME